LGAFAAAGAALVPRSLAALRRDLPDIDATTREAPSPSLVRAIRSGSLDFAIITARPPYRSPDQETPRLVRHDLFESRLALAVPATSRYAAVDAVDLDTAAAAPWIATAAGRDEPQLGVWPGLPGRPKVRHWARDWATKLALVAEGAGITTVAAEMFPQLPDGVAVARLVGVPEERRLVSLVHRRDAAPRTVDDVVEALAAVSDELVRIRRRVLPDPG
jgi:DNA-binding transcriptional LysR family regulator